MNVKSDSRYWQTYPTDLSCSGSTCACTPALAHSSLTISPSVRPSHEWQLSPFSNR